MTESGTEARPRARSEYKSDAWKTTGCWRFTGPGRRKLGGMRSTKSPSSSVTLTSGADCTTAGAGSSGGVGSVMKVSGVCAAAPPVLGNEMVRGVSFGCAKDGAAPLGVVRRLTGRTLFGTATRGERNSSALLGSSGFGTGGGAGTDSATGSSLAEGFDFEPNNLLKEKAMAAWG